MKRRSKDEMKECLSDGMALAVDIETVYMHFCEHVDGRLGKLKIP